MRVLSVTHGPSVPGGVFDEAVEATGHTLERWQVPDGGSPDRAASYDAVMVFGGSMHPDQDDRFHWLANEEQFLADVLAARVPVFGVCLGAQMLARAAGAAVRPASGPEIGWLDVELTAPGSADPVLGTLRPSATVFQWHHYTFDVAMISSERARSSASGIGSSSGSSWVHVVTIGSVTSAWNWMPQAASPERRNACVQTLLRASSTPPAGTSNV